MKMAYCFYFIVMLVTSLMDQTFGYIISLNKNAELSQSLQIDMNIGTITTVVALNRPDGSLAGNCLAPLGGTSAGCAAGFTQDLTNGITTFSIASVSRTTDEGTWTSSHSSETGNISITVLSKPTLNVAQTVSALTLSSSNTQTLTIKATCAYPAVSLVLYFVPTGGGTALLSASSTSSCTNSSSSCADTDAQDYTCDIVPKLEASLPAGTYYMLVVVNLAGQYESIGLNATITDTELTVIASRVCDDCEKTVIPLGSFGMVFALLVAAFCWLLYCLLSGKCSSPLYERAKDGDIEFTTKKLFWSTVIATVLCFLGFVFCLAGVIICALCEEGVTTSGKVTAALILVIIGFAFALIIMIVEIILLVLVCCRKIKIKDSTCQRATPDGQEGQPPTTTESNIRTETSPRPLRDASNDTPRGKLSGVPANRQLPPLAMTDQVDARQKANQLAGVPANRQLPPLATTGQVDASQKANQLEPIENTETKKLKKKKKRRSKEEKAQADDEN